MADNVAITAGAGTTIVTDETAAGHIQVIKIAAGAADSVARIDGDATNGLDVDVTRMAPLVAGSAAIGKLAANSGVDIGDVDITSIAAGDNNIGNVDIASIAAGDNNIGNVDVASLPALAAGTNNIGDVDVLTVITGVGATNLGKAEDAAHSSGDTGVAILAVRSDTTPASTAGTAGDYALPNIDANGRLYVNATMYTAAGAAIAPADDYTHDAALTVASTAGPATVCRAIDSAVAAVSAGDDAVLAVATLTGKPISMPYAPPGATWQYAAAAGGLVTTGGVTAKAAGAAGVRNYVTSIQVINSHPTISTEVAVKDGAAGTVIHRGWAQAGGGGYACRFDPPLRGTAATLIEIAEVTATASTGVLVNVQGFQAAE